MEVRFRDCDLRGHVNHVVFLTYFEQCRLSYWRQETGIAEPNVTVIVAHVECDYRAPAYFGDELDVRMNIGDIGRTSFSLVFEVVNARSGVKLADGRAVMVAYDYAVGAPVTLPAESRQLLEKARK
jgi:acyl-CoA thioester hydrolase